MQGIKIKLLSFAMISSLALAANADGLTLTNFTDTPATAILNHGECTSKLGGVIMPDRQPHHISQAIINLGCGFAFHNCEALIYMSKDCSGEPAARGVIDEGRGIVSLQTLSSAYNFDGWSSYSVAVKKA